jgi:outer membrane receptor protein involved in Fe transport
MTSRTVRAALAALAASTSLPALAQSGPQAPSMEEQAAGDDVIVTAQKRAETIADVPITISALTGNRLREIGVTSLAEAALFVPGLRIQEQSANNPGIVIRGITSDSGSAQQGARVTLYYNGVDISRSRGAYQDLYDIARVEVVKGPQATLFGTAAAIGAVSIISNPAEAGFAAGIEATYGNFDRTQAQGFVNIGNDVIAGRLAFGYKYRDGYVRNIAGDRTVPNQNASGIDQDDLYAQNQAGVRGSIRYAPSDSVTANLVLTWDGQRNSGTPFKSRAFAPTGGQTGDFGVAELSGSPFSAQVLGKRKLGLDRDVYDANLTVSVDLSPGVSFTTVNGYRKFDSLETFDADGGPAWYLEFAEDARGDQYSHESRFQFEGAKYRASFGWNVFLENGLQRVPFSSEEGTFIACSVAPALVGVRDILNRAGLATGPACVAPNGQVRGLRATAILTGGRAVSLPYASEFTNYGRNNAYSVFGETTWIPTPALELTAGARILIEDRHSAYSSIQPNSVILSTPTSPRSLTGTANTGGARLEAAKSYAAVLPRFNALWRVTDAVNLYATVSKGRRSPVVQVSATQQGAGAVRNLQLVPEEITWNYEGGIKLGRGRLTGTLGVYYQTYNGFQVSVTNPAGVTTTQSAGSANNLGVELDAQWRPVDALTLFGSFGYINGGISRDALPNGGVNVFAGNRFRLQPEVMAAGGATLRLPAGEDATFYATPSVTYQSRVFFELPNNPAISQGGYTLVNLRAGVEFGQGRYRLGGFARNLTNERYLLDAGNTGGGFGVPTYIPAEPRFYGIEIAAKL